MQRREATVTPEGWLSRGEAYVSGDGVQLAVFGGIPGERARIRFLGRGTDIGAGGGARRIAARWIAPGGPTSPHRVTPPCERWASCGRCRLMHLGAAGQVAARDSLWREAFGEGAPAEVGSAAPSKDALHAITLTAGRSDTGRPRLGYDGLAGVVPIPDCPVVVPELRHLMAMAAHAMLEQELRPADARGGAFRGIVARRALSSQDLLLTVIFTRAVPFARPYAEALASVPGTVGVLAHWNETPGKLLVPGADVSSLQGKPYLEERVDDGSGKALKVRVGAADPWYDTLAARDAHLRAVEALGAESGDAVADINCGLGMRTLLLARRAGWALGVEIAPGVVDRARQSASGDASAAEFETGSPREGARDPSSDDVPEETLAEVLARVAPRLAGRRPRLIVDTGTRGLDAEVRAQLLALDPRRVVLLGTNPRALARDATAFVHAGKFARGPGETRDVDPHTPFAQGIVVLDSTDGSAPTKRAPRRMLAR
jgi:23S rRNA (uracil1939-C5)-methyltransferase